MQTPKILIVDDDKSIRTFLEISLAAEKYSCIEAENALEAIAKVTAEQPALVLLDLGLPDIDGAEVLKQIRKNTEIPVIVVSARGKDEEKVAALDLGADDYVTKPFSLTELLARIRVVLRRQRTEEKKEEGSSIFQVRGLVIDFEKRLVSVDRNKIHLTPIEYQIVCLLAQNAGRVLTHKQVAQKIWGSFMEDDMHTLRVNMANIRRKIEKDTTRPEYILTEVGVGYRMLDE